MLIPTARRRITIEAIAASAPSVREATARAKHDDADNAAASRLRQRLALGEIGDLRALLRERAVLRARERPPRDLLDALDAALLHACAACVSPAVIAAACREHGGLREHYALGAVLARADRARVVDLDVAVLLEPPGLPLPPAPATVLLRIIEDALLYPKAPPRPALALLPAHRRRALGRTLTWIRRLCTAGRRLDPERAAKVATEIMEAEENP